MEPIRGYNLYKTKLSAIKTMTYLEKHQVFEVLLELILELNQLRPVDIRKYIAENIKRIANKVKYTRTFILAPPIFDTLELAKLFERKMNAPVIICSKLFDGNVDNTEEMMKQLKNFLEKNGLDKKHQIYINFPKSCKELKCFRKQNIEPTSVIEIKYDFQVPFKTQEMYAKENEKSYLDDFNIIKEFYDNIYRTIYFGSRESLSKNSEKFKQTFKEIFYEITDIIRHRKPSKATYAFQNLRYRVIIFGRRGSGRRTQALSLAKRFNLVYNVEILILQTLQNPGIFSELLKLDNDSDHIPTHILIGIIYKRISQRDCLANGWVLINFPHTKNEFELMMKFASPPNKIVVLHTKEELCLNRLMERWENMEECKCGRGECSTLCRKSKDRMVYIKEEMRFFETNKFQIYEYLSKLKETIHINGNQCYETVKNSIHSKIVAIQNDFGLNKIK